MSKADTIALVISLLAVLVTGWISIGIFEGIPHLEDEFAYVWQAQVIARGELVTPSPPEHKSFLVPFVVDHNGQRFGKYPLGWPVVLSLGEMVGLRWLVNPLLAGLGVWLTYRLGTKIFGAGVGLLAAGLTATSPFFLMNSGSLLSHPWGLVLSIGFVIAWLDTLEGDCLPGWVPTLTAGITLGTLVLSRPLTAFGVAVPFGIHGFFILSLGSPTIRKRIVTIGIITVLVGSLHFIWQLAVTGDPWLNPYTLWWEYDRVGFGPDVGVSPDGHTLQQSWRNLKFSLNAGYSDLFGWKKASWLFLPFGLWAIRKESKAWLITTVFPMLLLVYMAYWIGAWVLGPRYYYEGLFSLTILTAAGIAWLANLPLKAGRDWPISRGRHRFRPIAVSVLVIILVSGNLFLYLPERILPMRGMFGTSRLQLEPFIDSGITAQTPALIIVDTNEWRGYAGLLELANPMLDSPFIFVWSRGPKSNSVIMESFPERNVFYYDPSEPLKFYKTGP